MARNTGGPAFPRPAGTNGALHPSDRWENDAQAGMTLRDWFAGQALAGMMADSQTTNGTTFRAVAAEAYAAADAMLVVREGVDG